MDGNYGKQLENAVNMEVVSEDNPHIHGSVKTGKIEGTTKHLKVGETYKITGGKYKKYKTCILAKINETYSDVNVKGDPPIQEPISCKVKNIYLLRLDPPGWDMPDADQLEVVEDLEKYLKENPDEKFDGKPELIDGEVVDNITDVLPSMTDALDNIKELDSLRATLAQRECADSLIKMSIEEVKTHSPPAPSGALNYTSAQVREITQFIAEAIKTTQN